MIEGLSHITFIVRDIEKTSSMLEQILGGKKIYDSGEKIHSLYREMFYIVGGQWIAIMESQDIINQSYHHVAFKISDSDVDYYLNKIRKSDLQLKEPRERIEGEGYSIYFYDYDNNLFELHTGSLEDRLRAYGEVDKI